MIATDSAAPGDCREQPRRHISERETARTILGLLLGEQHPWTRVELARELGGQRIDAHDAIENLVCSGLANSEGEMIVASRAARAFDELEP